MVRPAVREDQFMPKVRPRYRLTSWTGSRRILATLAVVLSRPGNALVTYGLEASAVTFVAGRSSMRYHQLRSFILELSHSSVGHLGVVEVEDLKVVQTFQMQEPSITHVSVMQKQKLQIG